MPTSAPLCPKAAAAVNKNTIKAFGYILIIEFADISPTFSNAPFAPYDIRPRIVRLKSPWAWQDCRNPGSFALGKAGSIFAVPVLRCRLYAINAVPHFDTVQIDFHDAFFSPDQ